MEFSYLINNNPILESITLDFSDDKLLVITGVENIAFEILGGVIAGLFPIKKEETFSQLEEITKYFSGELIMHSGHIPLNGLYMGADPDRHILFSKVKEEIYAQLGFNINPESILKIFGLENSFLNRKIITLSGGEKVKVALGILFSKKADCIVLHGVLPWLDKKGKNILKKNILKSLHKGIKVVILEQEIEIFNELDSNFYYFNGKTVIPYSEDNILEKNKSLFTIVDNIKKNVILRNSKNLLSFENVFFDYNQKKNDDFLLNDISFTFLDSRIYGLTGENGSGKSTIAKLITRILNPLKGSIYFEDESLKKLSRQKIIDKISYVGQFPERQLVYGDVEQYKQNAIKNSNSLSIELLNKFFKSDKNYPMSILNPLQLKLLLLFASISKNTRLIILDEPTWGIDIDGQIEIAKAIDFLIKNVANLTVLLISHDRKFLNKFSTNVLVLSKSKIIQIKE